MQNMRVTNMRFRLDQFCGFAGSSVVYQSTSTMPSEVFFGAMGMLFVRSSASCCSTSKRSLLYGIVSALLLVLVTPRSSRSLSVEELLAPGSNATVGVRTMEGIGLSPFSELSWMVY